MLPELTLLIGILVILLLLSFNLFNHSIPLVFLISVMGVLSYESYNLVTLMQGISIVLTFWVLLVFDDKKSFSVLLMLSLLGAMSALGSESWIRLYVSLELLALPLYALVVFNQQALAKEAALKYFVMGSIGSLLILYGISFVYLATGGLKWYLAVAYPNYYQLGFVMILSGFFIKLGLAPFHMWVPDIYQTAPLGILAWIATVPKIVIFTIMIKLFHNTMFLSQILFLVGGISVVYGALMAITQTNLRRLMAYASISHIGIMIIPMGLFALGYLSSLYYLMAYIVMNMVLFSVLNCFEKHGVFKVSELHSMGYTRSNEAGVLTLVLISMAGIPPFAGFLGKLNILYLLANQHHYHLIAAILLAAVASGYYYLNIIRIMYDKTKARMERSSGMLWIYTIPILLFTMIPNQVLLNLDMVVKGIIA